MIDIGSERKRDKEIETKIERQRPRKRESEMCIEKDNWKNVKDCKVKRKREKK